MAAEIAAKRERSVCYNCAEKFSQEHLKVCPMKGLPFPDGRRHVPQRQDLRGAAHLPQRGRWHLLQ
jgi:hypothetical protein